MKNGKFFLLVSLTLILLSLTNVNAATENDFVELTDDNVSYFTHKDIVNSRYLVGSDKVFYGSKTGLVTIKIYLKDRLGSGDYQIGLKTRSKNIRITSIKVNNKLNNIISISSKDYIYPSTIFLDNNITTIELTISFDPLEIGVREEVDIILYKDGIIVEVYDPFLSGFPFRQQWIMNTNGIGLGGDVTNDHTILIHISATNTDFWANHSFTDSNGMDFTQSDELTLLNWDTEGFDATLDDANIWVNYTPVFSSTFDSNGWMYYGGSNNDNSDGTAAYPSDLNAVYHSNDASGGTVDSTSNTVNMTEINTPTYGVDGQIDSAIDYQLADDDYQKTSNFFVGSSGSIAGWFNFDTNTANHNILGVGDEGGTEFLSFQLNSDGFIEIQNTIGTTDTIHGTTPIAPNEWHHVVVTSNGSTYVLYLDGVAESLVVEEGSNTGEWFSDATNRDNSTIGAIERSSVIAEADGTIDEVRVFTSTLSADEVRILYNSENDSLVTFESQELNFIASFTFNIDPPALNPELGINSVNIDLNDTSTIPNRTIQDWNYFIDGTRFYSSTVDGNTTRVQTTAGDFNISFLIVSTDGNVSQSDQTITVGSLAQNVDINFVRNVFSLDTADINFGVTFDGSAIAFNWGFPGDQNQLTQNIQKTFTANARQEVCVTITVSGDINSTTCEFFNIGRVLTKIPLDLQITSLSLTTFGIITDKLPPQSYTGLSVDSNVLFFTDLNSFEPTLSIDFNSDYFGTSRTFLFESASLFFEFQPYLVSQTGNLESTIFTIDNEQGRINISGIRIESRTDINGSSVLVESKFSDGTGQALFHFVKGQEYTLSFFDSSGTLLTTKNIEANDTQYFVFLNLIVTDPIPTPQFSVSVIYDPSFANVIPRADGNISFSPIIKPTNGTLIDINVFISHLTDTNIVYNQVFTANSTGDFNLSFDFNVAGFNDNFPLTLNLQILDSSGDQVGTVFSKSYSFKEDTFQLATERTKDAIGQFGVTLIALILVTFFIGQLTKRAIGEDTNFVVIPAMFLTGTFVFIGWIEFDVWASGVMFSVGLALWGVKK